MAKQITISTIPIIITCVMLLASVAVSWGMQQQQISTLRSEVDGVKAMAKADHDSLIEIKNDVKWMREQMEKAHD
jgi:hypothetical protein